MVDIRRRGEIHYKEFLTLIYLLYFVLLITTCMHITITHIASVDSVTTDEILGFRCELKFLALNDSALT